MYEWGTLHKIRLILLGFSFSFHSFLHYSTDICSFDIIALRLKALFNKVTTLGKSELHHGACYQCLWCGVNFWSPEKKLHFKSIIECMLLVSVMWCKNEALKKSCTSKSSLSACYQCLWCGVKNEALKKVALQNHHWVHAISVYVMWCKNEAPEKSLHFKSIIECMLSVSVMWCKN